MKINGMRCFIIGVISFVVMLAALCQIPRLQDINTCVSAAFIITGAYAWFAGVLWANLILPLMKK